MSAAILRRCCSIHRVYATIPSDLRSGSRTGARCPRISIVLGGDCSIMLGCLLALRRRERHGLLFLDGHPDFYQPRGRTQWRGGIDGARARHGPRTSRRDGHRGNAAAGASATRMSSYSGAAMLRRQQNTAASGSKIQRSRSISRQSAAMASAAANRAIARLTSPGLGVWIISMPMCLMTPSSRRSIAACRMACHGMNWRWLLNSNW